MFFCEESYTNVVTLKAILRGFELASGLKINFHKSKLTGINFRRNALDCYAKSLNCVQMGIPFKYLGLEVGGNPRKSKFWEPVLNKLKDRLSVWKGRFLSLAGRVCLLKSVLTSIPLYYLSLYKAPTLICKSIIRIQRRFLWGWGKENKFINWVSWEVVCKSTEEGGLGVRDIKKFNTALLAKWRWRYISEDMGKWKELLESKYGSEMQNTVKLQSWWWKDLLKVCREGGGEGWFGKEVGWKLGCGDKIRFWEDVWIGNCNLKTQFPRLYSLSLNQGQKVEEVGVWEQMGWCWRLRWRRDRFVWESELVEDLHMLIASIVVHKEEKDVQVWRKEEEGRFSVTSAYECLTQHVGGHQHEVFKSLWKTKAFPCVLTVAWKILLNRLPTRDCLSRRGVLVETTLCALCQVKENRVNTFSWNANMPLKCGPCALGGLEFWLFNIMMLWPTLRVLTCLRLAIIKIWFGKGYGQR